MSKPRRISYGFMAAMLFVVASLHLATPLITVLFSFFALHLFNFGDRKFLASGLFLCLCTAVLLGLAYFFNQAMITAPIILDKLLPVIMKYSAQLHIALPFEDVESFKRVTAELLVGQAGTVGNWAKHSLYNLAMMIIGIVVALSLFANAAIVIDGETHTTRNNLYTLSAEEIAARFATFYKSFATVMGAQIIISSINTCFTTLFIVGVGMPYASLLVVVTFLCGLLPILGNILSNTIIVSVALTMPNPYTAVFALLFLIVIHKGEYFLNSQIIGSRIKNPMWLTLLALMLGERLMGIAGMILAPVILHYIKSETSKVRVVRRRDLEVDGEEDELKATPTASNTP